MNRGVEELIKQIVVLLIIVIMLGSVNVYAFSENISNNELFSEIKELKESVLVNENHVKEVRRDQINYEIEKNLLKETYSSIIQAINIVIMIVLGVFTVIGFFGVKSIDAIRSDFRKELDELKRLKLNYEMKFEEISKDSESAKEEFKIIKDTNENQNRRLQLLEIQEKAGSFIQSKNYNRALDFIDTGLIMESNDPLLLQQKAHCFTKLGLFENAAKAWDLLIDVGPDKVIYACNLVEMLLFSKNIELYQEKIKEWADHIEARHPGWLLWYFELVKIYLSSDVDVMKAHVRNKLNADDEIVEPRIFGWEYEEANIAFRKDPDSDKKKILIGVIQLLIGTVSQKELYEMVSK